MKLRHRIQLAWKAFWGGTLYVEPPLHHCHIALQVINCRCPVFVPQGIEMVDEVPEVSAMVMSAATLLDGVLIDGVKQYRDEVNRARAHFGMTKETSCPPN